MMLLGSSKEITSASSFENEQLCRQFTLKEIEAATRYFRPDLKLGEVGFGTMYKGYLSNEYVSIIRTLVSGYGVNFQELLVEIKRLANLQHPNIVRFIGYCHADIYLFSVCEYMPRGTLDDHLHRIPGTPLSWLQRLKICIDAARALEYLHSGKSGQSFPHGAVTSSHIWLDVQLTAKIAVLIDNQITNVSTYGYDAPEYLTTGHKNTKSDVYSFGVILLEVLCRRHAVDRRLDKKQDLVTWAQQYQGNLKKIIDPELEGHMSQKCLNDYAKIVKCCLRANPQSRSTMAEVVVGLESILDKTTSDMSLGKHISSSGLKSEEGYLRKAVKFLSSKCLKHKDHGNISDIKAISEASEKNLKQNITISSDELNPPSEPNRAFIDEEVLSTSRMESSRDLQRSNYLQRAYILTRKKDFLHLMWFYPVKKEAEFSFGSLLDKFSSLNKYIRMSLDTSTDTSFPMEIQILLQDIEEYVDDAAFDMVAYLPEDLVQNRFGTVEFQNLAIGAKFGSFWSGIREIHASSIDSTIYRALRCIKDLNIKMLGIWGNGVEEVTATLRDLPELKSAFDLVLFVRTKHHTSIKYLMNDIEQEIDLWKKRSSESLNEIDVLQDQLLNCLLFVDCGGGFFDLHEHQFRLSKWFQNVQIVMTSESQLAFWQVELEIRIQDHRLPWNIFFKNVDIATIGEDSGIKQLAVRMVEKCDGHLLAIILLARALRGVVEIGVWELALQELVSSSQSGVISDVMVRVLRFVWPRMETISQKCILQFALQYTRAEFEISSLINCWTISGVVKSETEAEYAFEDLERLFLIERVAEKFVRMRDETRVALLGHFIPRTHGLYLKQDGSKSNEMPSIEEWDVREIHLTNNILSELPDNPKCPILVDLFLHSNQELMDVPITFFDNMPSLQVLDFSSTSLKSLPSSISRLTTLRKLFIRNCDLMMELPPEIGSLKNLKVFDSEGTQLICLPEQVGSLTKLECLKFSLYNFPDKYKRSNQNVQIIPAAELSKLVHLKELSICVDMYSEWWENEVKRIINILPKLRNLESLRLHFPTTELFCMFTEQKSWEGLPIYQHLSNFKFIVGHLQQRLISRHPFNLDKMFVKLPKCLKFTSTEGEIEVISSALKHANALFLDRHWTIQSLSTFGLAEMKNLKFCLLVECSEMLEIVNGRYLEDFSQGRVPVLGSLEYISIHHMKNLSCIWNGPIHYGCLSNLKTLVIHACPELRTIFTQGLLDNLTHIEYLAVEDCPKISSLVSLESNYSTSSQFLPSLKKISLLHLPELVTISNGTSIAPRLESLVVYNCPNLDRLSSMEVFDHVKEIKGENEWWDGLKWCEPEWTSGQPEYLTRVFIPLGTNGDIMDELADAVNFLPHQHSQVPKSGNWEDQEDVQRVNVPMMKGRLVLQQRNMLDLNNGGASIVDGVYELFRQTISLQLVSAIHPDHESSGKGIRGKLGKETNLKSWKGGYSSFELDFDFEEDIGIPGAFLIVNRNQSEFYLKTLTLEHVPNVGRVHFICNSWVYPEKHYDNRYRVFFSNQTYLPGKTPEGLRHFREEELQELRGNGTGKREEWHRIYDYDVYNDLSEPDRGPEHVRPILGGSSEFPYPRRCRTGRAPSKTDPNMESRISILQSLNIYVPKDERFSDLKMADVYAYGIKLVSQGLLPGLESIGDKISDGVVLTLERVLHHKFESISSNNFNEFSSFEDVLKLYQGGLTIPKSSFLESVRDKIPSDFFRELLRKDSEQLLKFPVPQVIKEDTSAWQTDEEFGRELLAGICPVVIRRLQEFPPTSTLDPRKFGNHNSTITEDHIKHQLDGFSVLEAIKDRLFILDHHDPLMPFLRVINETSTKIYATRTILFLQNDGTLIPIAIELSLPHPDGDQFGAISTVHTPASEGRKGTLWLLAKAYANVNDSGYHQLICHWLHTHAAIEPFIIATNRQLSILHPIHKLLHPHFRDTMNINGLSRQTLINAGGLLEKTVFPDKYALVMSCNMYKKWDFTKQALPADLIDRGMAVEDAASPHGVRLLIDDYPFAVDGLEIWSAIKSWVKDYVFVYYKNDEDIQNDNELKSWWEEVRTKGHGDKKDEPWWHKMHTREELIESCTTIIWVASALHAAVNFGQYPYAGYMPNRPPLSRRLLPEPGTADYDELETNPEKAFLKTVTPKLQSILGMSLIEILSRHSADEVFLGERDTPEWTTDNEALEAFENFSANLREVEKKIDEMNQDKRLRNRTGPAQMPYTLLYPSSEIGLTGRGIPNSVSI